MAGAGALLPTGLRDVLPPDAAHEAAKLEQLVTIFEAHGYQRVEPPLVEFETTLLSNGGASLAEQMFRLMDPVSQRMLAVRTDMTLQVARIATTRLAQLPRPLRLSYGGQVLRIRGSQLRPERQFAQAGVELIGADTTVADTEVVLLAAEALTASGVPDITVDLNSPAIVAAVLDELALPSARAQALRAALDHKDGAAVATLSDGHATLAALVRTNGPADRVVGRLESLSLPAAAAAEVERLAAVAAAIGAGNPSLALTLDPVEYRGFEYQSSVSFTLLARGVRGELGRGGRYIAPSGEAATGFTLFLDSVMRAVAAPDQQARVFLPLGTPAADGARFRAGGLVTIAGLVEVADVHVEAQRLGCDHVLVDGTVVAADAAG